MSSALAIDQTFIQYHDPSNSLSLPLPHWDQSYSFGILKIKMNPETSMTKKHQHFIFSIDASSSMLDKCTNDSTKIDHILFTLQNMIQLFAEKKAPISIHINTFDDTTKNIVSNTLITKENTKDLIRKIHNIAPDGYTNIEEALKNASQDILNYKKENAEHEISHIFLTDGVPTTGTDNASSLNDLVLKEYTNIFIGYGEDHEPLLLNSLANNINGSYYFIDALEKASLVYGEIIHNILYKKIENVELHMTNGEIYNYITNTWDNILYIGNLVAEAEKIYQVRSTNPEDSFCIINGRNNNIGVNEVIYQNCAFPLKSPQSLQRDNLIKYAFRQYTQELLYEIKEFALSKNQYSPHQRRYKDQCYTPRVRRGRRMTMPSSPQPSSPTKKRVQLKERLKNFLDILMNYVNENDLQEDKFMKMLCDDIYINYMAMNTNKLSLFSCARQSSQGRQTIYHVAWDKESMQLEIPYPDYECSNHVDSPYRTQSVFATMQEMSH